MFTGTLGNQIDSLVDSSQGRHVDGLLSDDTTSTDSGGIFSGASHEDSVDEHLQGVSASEEVDYLEGVSDDTDGLDFFTSVSAVELHGADESFDDGAESLSEFLGLVSAGSVGHKYLSLD